MPDAILIVNPSTLLLLGPSAMAAPIVVRKQDATHVFDGVGGLSAGASSRLLFDYEANTRCGDGCAGSRHGNIASLTPKA